MPDFDLQEELRACHEAAETGYKISFEQYGKLTDALKTAQMEIRAARDKFAESQANLPETSKQLDVQLESIRENLQQLSDAFRTDLEMLHENKASFSIALFGRTMAGKSTLMEILTHGDGKSIGKGAQRTTRDVRIYTWSGLNITDVPGIGAFEGQEDEQIAFNAAKKADLILFLLTDDAPQNAEADCFRQIVALGKPVVIIMNVKTAISAEKSIKLAARDIGKKFDAERLETIRKQFLDYSKKYGQDWSRIPFCCVQLKAAWMAQNLQDAEAAKQLYAASQLDTMMQRIVEIVRKQGRFFRVKTFADAISVPMLSSMEGLLGQYLMSHAQIMAIEEKKKQLIAWSEKFTRDSQSRLQSEVNQIRSDLYQVIPEFAERYCTQTDRKINEEWQKRIESIHPEDRCNKVLQELQSQCNAHLQDFVNSLQSSLNYISRITNGKTLHGNFVFDVKGALEWGTIGVGAIASIGAIVAQCVGMTTTPFLIVGTVAAVMRIVEGKISLKNRNAQFYEARNKLEKELREDTDRICEYLLQNLGKRWYEIFQSVADVLQELKSLQYVLVSLEKVQQKLAWDLKGQFENLNLKMLTEALRMTGGEGLQYHISNVARIPGTETVIMTKPGSMVPIEYCEKLIHLMEPERIRFIEGAEDTETIIRNIMDLYFIPGEIRVDENKNTIWVKGKNHSAEENARYRLIRQMTERTVQFEEVQHA